METREIYWNVQGIWAMYALFAATLVVFGYGVYRHYRLITAGQPARRFDQPGQRLKLVALHALLQWRSLRDRYSGAMHLGLFWGFAVLFLGTVVVLLQADLGVPVMHGPFYLYFQSLTLDVVGLVAMVAILMALFKRYVLQADRLLSPSSLRNPLADAGIPILLLAILATGFLLEGMRIVGTADPWADWSPAGGATGLLLQKLGLDAGAQTGLHRYLWWFHLLIAFAFIACIPYSKLRHILFSPLNVYFQTVGPRGVLEPIDIDTAESLGTPRFEDFMWKRLLDAEACTECGRCQDACPAYVTGQPLSPKAVVLDLRNRLYALKGMPLARRGGDGAGGEAPAVEAVTAEALWTCVTCGSCMEQCPVFIEHVPAIVDLRRYLAMEKAEYPELMAEAMTCLEARGHPFRGTRFSRTDWCEGLDVKVVGESGPAEWLYWVGCAAAFDERSQKVARAFASLLQRAGVEFAILGDEEICTGDAARRMGNEYLYQTLARQNVETFERYGIKKVVTTCPHCFNTLKHEYPQFGAELEVYHHTELLGRLLREGKLRLEDPGLESLTLHDSCYLARCNGIVEPPRQILRALPGVRVAEVERRREQTFCCGGGSGHLWFEEFRGGRINHQRAEQALATGARAVATACPFCMIMLSDGVKTRQGEREVAVLDVAEVLEMATRKER